MKNNKTHNKALQLSTKSGAALAFGSTELIVMLAILVIQNQLCLLAVFV